MSDIMRYGKAKGTLLAEKYLPKLFPFKDVAIVTTIEEWNAVKEKYGDFTVFRVDMANGQPRKNAVKGVSGFTESIPGLLETIKEQKIDGGVLLMTPKEQAIPRYENDGGINVLFNMGKNVIIELVGKGFDAHELSQGEAIHERYQIPWDQILFMRNRLDLLKSTVVKKDRITPEQYTKQREKRIQFLQKECHYDRNKVEENVPQQYQLIDDRIIQKILDDVLLELFNQQDALKRDGLTSFVVQGNIAHGKVQPWEIFRAERIMPKEYEMER